LLRKTPYARLELMKKVFLLFSLIFIIFLFFKTNSAFAQSCNCVSTLVVDDIGGVHHYECKPESLLCPNGGSCQCDPQYSDQPIPSCNPGTCLEPLQCSSLPNTYCTYKCGFGSNILSASCPYETQVCCEISGRVTNTEEDCVKNCSTSCVFGISLPGFVCRVEDGVCACYPPTDLPPDITPPPEEDGSISTAIGDIDPRNLQGFIQKLLNLALGVAGGIAFLLMLFGAFQIMTSSGDPEKMKSGSELITSALTGLLFIIFSIFLLKLIGVDILKIPGFGLP